MEEIVILLYFLAKLYIERCQITAPIGYGPYLALANMVDLAAFGLDGVYIFRFPGADK